MNVALVEVCRSPEIDKGDTEAVVLSRIFQDQGIDHAICSNDGIWPERVTLSKKGLRERLSDPGIDIVHLAVHGDERGLVLEWTAEPWVGDRTSRVWLTRKEIEAMPEWRDRLIVSGACASAQLAPAFLAAGATGVVAPETEVPWRRLGDFFAAFYARLFDGQSATDALAEAKSHFAEFESYRAFT